MDIPTAVSVVSQSIGIVKQLRDLDRDFDKAAAKAQMAELYSNLADVKMALTDARHELQSKSAHIRELEKQIEDLGAGERCPVCTTGRIKVVSTRAHPHFGTFGHELHKVQCQTEGCGYQAERHIRND